MLTHSGTPKAINNVLNAQVAKILEMPDIKDRLQTIGFDPAPSTSEAAAAHMRSETEKWTKVVRDANIKIE